MQLIDCYTELLAYTGLFLGNLGHKQPEFQTVSNNYKLLVSRSQQFGETAQFSVKLWRDGFFAICAWIDESILCSSWAHTATWRKEQLQKQYFKTTTAGKDFFERLGLLPKEETEVRGVYEYCLALGFRGIYYNPLDKQRLEEIQLTNLQSLLDNLELELPEALFPDIYAFEAEGKRRKWFKWSKVPNFLLTFLLISIVFMGSTYFVFRYILNSLLISHFGVE